MKNQPSNIDWFFFAFRAWILHITASIGVARRNRDALSMSEIQQRADQAIYAAKAGERNRISLFAAPDAC